jgi:hypothetical protein
MGMSRDEVVTADGAADYGLDNAGRNVLARLRSLEEWLDSGTIRHLRALDVGAIRACQDPGFACMSQVTMAAWGRRR